MIIKKNDYLEKKTVNVYADIYKKYSNAHLEISEYKMKKGGAFYLTPPEYVHGYKSYLVLKGGFIDETTEQTYSEGDLLLLRKADDYSIINILEDSILYLTTYGEANYETTEKRFDFANKMLDEIQEKDDYTNQHCFRVFMLAKTMAAYLKLSGKELYAFLTAARYHDLGKIKIDDDLLKKPGFFTDEEYISMKAHVLETRNLLETTVEEEVCLIAEQHHERLNGSGYPYGLKSDEISSLGKALAVLDTYDAMTTDRVYKKGKTSEEALQELYDMADVFYDRFYIELLEKIISSS